MNICILTNWYPTNECPHSGIFVKEQAIALSEIHNIVLVAFDINYKSKITFNNCSLIQTEEQLFEEYYLTVNKSIPIYNQINFFYSTFKIIKKLIKKKNIDIIHCHVSYPSGIVGMFLSKSLKIPFIITEHSSPFESLFRSFFHKRLTLLSLNKSNTIITVSQSSARNINKYINKEVRIVHNLLPNNKIEELSKNINKKFNIGFLGGLNTNQKGLDILLKAIALLDEKEDIIVHIGGDGLLIKEYIQMSKSLNLDTICNFYGKIEPKNVQKFMNKLDIFILPSRHETFGIVAIEAMACGIPVISTRCGGPEEFINFENGLLIENMNIEALSKSIQEIRRNYCNFDRKKIQEFVQTNFGNNAFIKKINSIYNQTIYKNDN